MVYFISWVYFLGDFKNLCDFIFVNLVKEGVIRLVSYIVKKKELILLEVLLKLVKKFGKELDFL